MKSLKIKNHGTGDYTVTVTAAGVSKNYDFNTHEKLTDFVFGLKKKGYVVVNDIH